jgi:hypothetical protein
MSFYNQLGGAGQDFLYADPLFEDNRCIKQTFSVGDGETIKFRLVHQFGNFVEPVFGINNKPLIYVNGNQTNSFAWDKQGLITFSSPPALGAELAWTGRWFYRCHFQNDEAEFSQIFSGGWELEELVLESIKLE